MNSWNLQSHFTTYASCLFFYFFANVESQEITNKNESRTEISSIQGKIKYQPDPEKPWRFGRYYLHGKEKLVAESVIELVPLHENLFQSLNAATRQRKTHLMDQENFMFIPETLAIQKGDKVRFKNSEEAFHNVMCMDDKPPFNINLAKNQEHIHEPKVANGALSPLNINCVFHGAMKGWIFVFDHPYYSQTTKDGFFHFQNIPPGRYRLRVAHPAGSLYMETKPRKINPSTDAQWDVVLSPDNLKPQSK